MNPRQITIDTYNYPLPDERIARHPLAQRDACKLLVSDGTSIADHIFSELPALLPSDAMLVYNNTRVINASLRFSKSTGALIEIFCLEPHTPADYEQAFASTGRCSWQCLVGNSKKWKEGELTMGVDTRAGHTTLLARRLPLPVAADRSQSIDFVWDNPNVCFTDIIAAVGEIPIPPYLNRRSEASDSTDYQTVYSHIDGSVAAPTAGLHFTPALLEAIDRRGIERRELTLHVGAGTFRPVKSERIGEHDMHSEFIAVDRSLIGELAATERRIIAVGTTSVRTLESLYHLGCRLAAGLPADVLPQWYPYDPSHPDLPVAEAMKAILSHLDTTGENTFVASTRLMIAPGYRYRVVKGMVTNFHQPKSTLLLLVSAFLASDPANPDWREIYDYALADSRYRFLSYGDACLFL